jgi:hypothetical protein
MMNLLNTSFTSANEYHENCIFNVYLLQLTNLILIIAINKNTHEAWLFFVHAAVTMILRGVNNPYNKTILNSHNITL